MKHCLNSSLHFRLNTAGWDMKIISPQPCSINPTSHGISDSVTAILSIQGGGGYRQELRWPLFTLTFSVKQHELNIVISWSLNWVYTQPLTTIHQLSPTTNLNLNVSNVVDCNRIKMHAPPYCALHDCHLHICPRIFFNFFELIFINIFSTKLFWVLGYHFGHKWSCWGWRKWFQWQSCMWWQCSQSYYRAHSLILCV